MADNIIGTLPIPPWIPTGYIGLEGMVVFFNNLIRLFIVIAGIYALISLFMAGLKFISASGDPKAVGEAWSKIYNSLIGLVVIIVSFTLISLIGVILTGDPGYFLNITLFVPKP